MTASAAEVQAAQKAMDEHSDWDVRSEGDIRAGRGLFRCRCGAEFGAPSGWREWRKHQVQAVADAVVAAAQPRIAAETLREESDRLEEHLGEPDENWTLTLVTSRLLNRADELEAQS